MRIKYNKKRNTAFIYESLISEIFKSIANEDSEKKEKVIEIIKEFFSKDSILFKEMQIYTTIYETRGVSKDIAERLINEAKKDYLSLDADKIFETQTSLINKINKVVSPQVFSNFVPNYRDLGTIHNILQGVESTKSRVLLENTLVKKLCGLNEEKQEKEYKPIDSLAYRQFIKKFNEEYGTTLSEGQKTIVSQYITSFVDDGLEFKMFISEKLNELKHALDTYKADNPVITEGIESIARKFNNFESLELNEELLLNTLKLQSLVEEINYGHSS